MVVENHSFRFFLSISLVKINRTMPKIRKVRESTHKFKVEDYVFAHIRGFKPWPGQIKEICRRNGHEKFKIVFFGTWQ